MASKSGGVIVVVSGEDKTGEVFNAVKKHLEETEEKAKETSLSLGNIAETLESGLATAGIAIGAREIVGGFKEMIQSTMEAGVEIGRLREQTGISAENLSELRYVAASTGTTFEALTKGFKNISTAVHEAEEGSPKATKAFADLGISVADLRAKGDDMLGVLRMVADKFHDLPAGIDKNAIATELFKKSGQDLIPVLDSLSGSLEEAKSHAAIFTDDDIQKMKEMHESVADLSAEWQKFELTITSKIAPGLAAFFQELSSGHATRDALSGFMGAWNPLLYTLPDAPTYKPKPPGLPPPDPEKQKKDGPDPKDVAKQQRAASELAALQERLDGTLRQLADAGAKLDETRARVHFQTMLSILEDMHKQGLVSEADYLTQKSNLQNAGYDAERTKLLTERRALTDQMNTLSSGAAKTGKDRLDTEIKLNALQAKNLEIESQLVVLDAKRATSARQIEEAYAALMAKPIDMSELDQGMPKGIFPAAKLPTVTLAKDYSQIDNEAEKFAHGLFDPLFNLGEKWDQQWKQIRANMLRDIGQTAESQLFGQLFGDSSGRGGKGWDGSGGDGNSGHNGLLNQGIGKAGDLLGGLFHKKSSAVSNGTGTAGAGVLADAAASQLGVGKAASSSAGAINVTVINQGTPQQVVSTSQSGDQGEAMFYQLVTKDLDTNGLLTQGILGKIQG
jgi:hypothetical protein